MKNKNNTQNMNFQKIYDSFIEGIKTNKHPKETSIISSNKEELDYLKTHKYRFLYMYKLLQKYHNVKILDVGTSHFTIILKKMGFDVSTIDINLNWKVRLKKEHIILKKCNLLKGKIPFEDNTFDIIIFNEVLEHLPINPKDIIDEFYRVLKKNGSLIIGTPNYASLTKRINFLFGINPSEMLRYKDSTGGSHIREYTMSEVCLLLKNNNFTVSKKLRPLYFDLPKTRKTILSKFFRTTIYPIVVIFPLFRRAMVVVAKK